MEKARPRITPVRKEVQAAMLSASESDLVPTPVATAVATDASYVLDLIVGADMLG
jgi:hypothetical protein